VKAVDSSSRRNVTAGKEIPPFLFLKLSCCYYSRPKRKEVSKKRLLFNIQSVSSSPRRPPSIAWHSIFAILLIRRSAREKRDVITRRAFGREGVQQLGNESSSLCSALFSLGLLRFSSPRHTAEPMQPSSLRPNLCYTTTRIKLISPIARRFPPHQPSLAVCVSLHSLCLPMPTLASIENRTVSTSSKYYTISVRVLYRKRRRKSLVFLFPVWYGRVYQQTTLDRKLLYSSVPDLFISSFLLLCTHTQNGGKWVTMMLEGWNVYTISCGFFMVQK
jgi:hypothetical protein